MSISLSWSWLSSKTNFTDFHILYVIIDIFSLLYPFCVASKVLLILLKADNMKKAKQWIFNENLMGNQTGKEWKIIRKLLTRQNQIYFPAKKVSISTQYFIINH